MSMKKIIYLVCAAQLLFACGKEEVRQEQVRKETPAPAESKVERPSDYILASRLVVEWNKNVDYLAKLDLDEAIATGSAKSLSWEVLRPYLHLYSSHQDGRVYQLTNEDLNDISLSSIKYSSSEYNRDEITFVAKYKGVSPQVKQALTFSKQDYFSKRIKPHREFIKTKFMNGIYRNLALWGGNLFSYDESKYGVQVTDEGKSISHSRDELSLKTNIVMRKYRNAEISQINFNFDGFKPLSSLKGKLVAIAQPELSDYFKRNEKVRLNLDFLNANFKVWRKYLEFGIKQGERSWSELRPKQDNPLILEGTNRGGVDLRDLYLESPVFEVVNAKLVGDDLVYTLQFRGVNESVSFTDFPLTVRVLVRK